MRKLGALPTGLVDQTDCPGASSCKTKESTRKVSERLAGAQGITRAGNEPEGDSPSKGNHQVDVLFFFPSGSFHFSLPAPLAPIAR